MVSLGSDLDVLFQSVDGTVGHGQRQQGMMTIPGTWVVSRPVIWVVIL